MGCENDPTVSWGTGEENATADTVAARIVKLTRDKATEEATDMNLKQGQTPA